MSALAEQYEDHCQGDTMRTSDFDVVDTLLHDLSATTSVVAANQDLTTCRDTTSDKNCGCGGSKPKPSPKPQPKPKPHHRSARLRVRD